MTDIIYIENENILEYVMFKLDKLENGFTTYELGQITDLVIDCDEEESNILPLSDLLKLYNINTLVIRNCFIYKEDLEIIFKLKYLNDITFENCDFENIELIEKLNLKSLSLYNCKIKDYSFISNITSLENLTLVNASLSISKLNKLKNITYLRLSNSKIEIDEKLKLNNIVELYIDNCNINNLEFIKELNNLKLLSIDKNQYNKNVELINELKSKNITIVYESVVDHYEV